VRFLHAVAIGIAASMAACVSDLDKESCDAYDGAPDAVRARVVGNLTIPPSANVLECRSVPSGSPDEESCVFALDPADFATIFPPRSFFNPKPPSRVGFALAQRHDLVIEGGLSGFEHGSGPIVYFNATRDRALLIQWTHRCGTPRSIIN
jgi:hypothetical protein